MTEFSAVPAYNPSIGAETLALHAIDQLQLAQKLTALGFLITHKPQLI